ncbi:reverse transcriptase domain-containing protein, partial [Paenibacillus macerans]|uniref:reverse transcriptase domain-containing protein n=1 Tax=Paenibacillus macerans TaxID=44252 RepID=UPI003D30FD35
AQQAIRKVKAYAEQGYGQAVEIDLSKYFDTLNHELLLNLLRKQIQDKRVIDLIKKYLKSGVMENGVCRATEEGSPQGGPLSPLLANIYLNEFDQEMESRGVRVIRYADDIVVLAKSTSNSSICLGEERKGDICTRTSSSADQGEEEAEKANESKPRQECAAGDGKRKGLHSRMDRLF